MPNGPRFRGVRPFGDGVYPLPDMLVSGKRNPRPDLDLRRMLGASDTPPRAPPARHV